MSTANTRSRCYRCGDWDHTTSDCTSTDRLCFNCRRPGHESRACPKPRGVLNRTCGGCGEKGHVADDCGKREIWTCKNCGDSGHGHWECSKPKGYRRKRCHLCKQLGHTSSTCENRSNAYSIPGDSTTQDSTGAAHSSANRRKRNRRQKCELCGGVGHRQWQCFERPCSPCDSASHESTLCFGRSTTRDHTHTDQNNLSPTPPVQEHQHESPATAPRCRQCGSHQHGSENCLIFQDTTNTNNTHNKKSTNETCSQPTKSQAAQQAPQKPLQPSGDEIHARSLWFSAVDELSLDNHDHAISLLSQAIGLQPGKPQYYLTRATAYVKIHQFAEALRDFGTASRKDGYEGDVDVFLQVARCRLLLGSPTSALLAVRDALALDAGDRGALELRKRIFALEGHVDAYKGAVSRKHWRMARSAYESCLAIYAQEDSDAPTHIRCWGIEMLVVEGSWEEAQKSVDVLLREDPDAIEAMVLRGLVLFLRAELPDAASQMVSVLKLDPDNHRAKSLRTQVKHVSRLKDSGNDAFGKGQWSEAEKSWSDALQTVEEKEEEGCGGLIRATLLLNRATVHLKLGTFVEGLKDVNESLKLRGTYHKAFLCRARLMASLELYETAIDDFRAALEHGKSTMGESHVRKVEAELEDAERLALKERQKEKDHYAILGLSRSCTAVEIKKAYRTLSLKHHPDKGGVAEKFKLIARAYEVLSDPEQKRTYDTKQKRSDFTASSRYDDSDSEDGYESDSGYW